jgi:uncharacterized protein (DUF1697 family)
MKETQYLILLRGINVGGNNIIRMADLKICFENMGFSDVLTYIQSGNVLFNSVEKNIKGLTDKIENVLSEKFSYNSRVVTITHHQLTNVISQAPDDFGKEPDSYRYDVLFPKEPVTTGEVLNSIKIREGVDTAIAGDFALYFSRLIVRASQSYLTKIISLPVYRNITIRNWNTTSKLLELMDNRAKKFS